MLVDVPVLPLPSVAVMVMLSAVVSSALMANVPAVSVLVLSPYVASPLLSNCTLPVPVIVTTVELSDVTVLPCASCAVTVTLKGARTEGVEATVTAYWARTRRERHRRGRRQRHRVGCVCGRKGVRPAVVEATVKVATPEASVVP